MELDFIRQRITELRLKKGVSEYKMSLDLGHSRSYIQHIVCGRSLPSIQELLYMEVHPAFDSQVIEILIQLDYFREYGMNGKL